MDRQTTNTSSTEGLYDNNNTISDDNDESPLWMTLMDQSQLVMTIVGFVANMATSVTLLKNGQVSDSQVLTKITLYIN